MVPLSLLPTQSVALLLEVLYSFLTIQRLATARSRLMAGLLVEQEEDSSAFILWAGGPQVPQRGMLSLQSTVVRLVER